MQIYKNFLKNKKKMREEINLPSLFKKYFKIASLYSNSDAILDTELLLVGRLGMI